MHQQSTRVTDPNTTPNSTSLHRVQVRLAGDRYVLVEYGPMELDLNLRVRVWALQGHLAAAKVLSRNPQDNISYTRSIALLQVPDIFYRCLKIPL